MKNHKSTIKEKVRNIVVTVLGDDEIKDDELLSTIGDSLDLADIVLDCEREFNMTIPYEEMVNFKTIKDIAEYVWKIKGGV